MKHYILVVIFGSLAVSQAQELVFNGTCPIVQTPSNFTTSKYHGTWYEISKFNNSLVNGECGNAKYAWSNNQFNVSYITRNGNVNVTNSIVLKPQFGTTPSNGRFDVYSGNVKQQIPYLVLDTDYNNYSVVWGCTYSSSSKKNTQRLFIYSRRATLAKDYINKANAVLNKYGIAYSKQKNVVQDAKKCGRVRTGIFSNWGIFGPFYF